MRRRLLAALGVVAAVGCATSGPEDPSKGADASAPSMAPPSINDGPTPSSPVATPPEVRAKFDAMIRSFDQKLETGHVTDRTTMAISGDQYTPDYRTRAKLKADAMGQPTPSKVDWFVKTGSPVHATPAAFSGWSASAATDYVAFAVDGTTGTRGLLSGQVNNDNNAATSQSGLIVVTNLYAGAGGLPDLKGYVPVATLPASEHFGLSGLLLSIDGTQVYALSAAGNLYCFTIGSGAMSACTGAWPYKATAASPNGSGSASSTVTWSSPFPLYNSSATGIQSIYFGDDIGYLHCVTATGANAGKGCWQTGSTTGPAQLYLPFTANVPVGQPIVNSDPGTGQPTIVVGDDKGRFYRVIDTGTTPVANNTTGSRIQESDLCTLAPNNCNANPWGIRGAAAVDFVGSFVYVTTNGSMYQFPLAINQDSANWGPDAASRTLFGSVNAQTEGSTILDYTNKYAYIGLHNSLYKTKIPFTGSYPGSNTTSTYSIALQNAVSGTSDNFPRGWAIPYYNSVYLGTGTNAGSTATGRLEQYGCIASNSAPVLEAVTTGGPYGQIVETGEILDWSKGNLYFGVDTGSTSTGNGLVQYPAGNPDPSGWACPTGTTSTTASCGGTACVSGCTGGPGHQGSCVNGSNVASETCSAASNGTCSVTTCNSGFADCDGNVVNGCETSMLTDPNNCGTTQATACGHVCPATNGTATCAAGVCGITCNSGYEQCTAGTCTAATCGSCCGSACGGGASCGTSGCQANTTTRTCGPTGGVVGEGNTVTVTCPTGSVIQAISYVSYGTSSGSCGSFSRGTCDDSFLGTGNANYAGNGNEGKIAADLCYGNNTCTIWGSNGQSQDSTTLGDPCAGTRKNIALQVECACPPALSRCANGYADGIETDVDCGGTGAENGCTAARCADTKQCSTGTDCASGTCTSNVCGAPACAGTANKCSVGTACGANSDCGSDICGVGGVGIGTCQQAGTGGSCKQNSDCTSNSCDTITGICKKVDFGAACVGPSDCYSGVCTSGSCATAANGGSCDVDADCASADCQCGASSGAGCATGDTTTAGACGAGKAMMVTSHSVNLATLCGGTTPTAYVEVWGAGGGGGGTGGTPVAGGGGGYTAGLFQGSSATNTLTVSIGGGGGNALNGTASGGANGGGAGEADAARHSGGGGGYTSVALGAANPLSGTGASLLSSGGGGAGGRNGSTGAPGGDGTTASVGGRSGANCTGGGGGTNSAVGAAGTGSSDNGSAGGSGTGGGASTTPGTGAGGGGGGSGANGGGGGGDKTNNPQPCTSGGGGGGNRVGTTVASGTGLQSGTTVTTAGSSSTPGHASGDYALCTALTPAGAKGAGGTVDTSSGTSGCVVIRCK